MQPFRLLDLPPELWIRICGFAVTHDEPIELVRTLTGYHGTLPFAAPTLPPITQTCAAIRAESINLYYSCNEFVCGNWCAASLWEWLILHSEHLQRVIIEDCSSLHKVPVVFHQLQFHPNLQHVSYEWLPSTRGAGGKTIMDFTGAQQAATISTFRAETLPTKCKHCNDMRRFMHSLRSSE